jgi:Zn-dependent M16 (insulinase) family peptidase
MSYETFELVREDFVPALNLKVEDYRHKVTGARHLHLGCEDDNNVFMVAFLTEPQDSTGVAHILEHTSLCGSQQFPVRDPFFMMIRRSLNNFMNAFTSSDWTAYPFASQNRKDFDNLLKVYLDAAFFPTLDQLDFLQEGHRLEFADPDNPESDLVFKGVVFNEMKGAMSSPTSVLHHALQSSLFPTTTYHYNSGGEPEDIPDLTWEQLKAFHAHHYHPSNATFLTYGDMTAKEQQQKFEQWALNRFGNKSERLMVNAEIRLQAPVKETISYAFDSEEDTSRRSHVVIGWLLDETANLNELMNAHLLSGVLLNNSASPLRQALETTDLASSPSDLCGLDDHAREFTFYAGVEGARAEDADAVENMILHVLNDVAENGVPLEQLESVLHQLELSQREIGGDGFPFGLKLMLNALPAAMHGGEPAAVLNLDPVLERLRRDIANPEFIKQLVRRYLLDNPHRVRMLMSPDRQLSQKKLDDERQRLSQLKAQLDEQQKKDIIDMTRKLKARQEQKDNPELLPKVTLEDINPDIKVTEGERIEVSGMPVTRYAAATNGLLYAHLVIDVPEMGDELLDAFSLFCECIAEVGVGGRDYLQTAAWHASVTGGIGARHSVRSEIDNNQLARISFILSGKALNRNAGSLAEILVATLDQARFDELERLKELVSQLRAHQESSITGHGHSLAMIAASAGLSPSAALAHRWDGLEAIRQLKRLDDALSSEDALQSFAASLSKIRAILAAAPRELLLVGEAEQLDELQQSFIDQFESRPGLATDVSRHLLQPQTEAMQIQQGWMTSTQVNFCSRAYAAVPADHKDAPAFTVLGGYLRNSFLHTAIREQGGAYGGGASYDSDAGAFRFYSYRDPRLEDTLSDFDASLAWLLEDNEDHEPRLLEEAILGVISALDRPRSPAGEAIAAYYSERNGRTPEQRRRFRKAVLGVTLEDLRWVVREYLKPDLANTAVISDPGKKSDIASIGLQEEHV